jgi:hypothetical protein
MPEILRPVGHLATGFIETVPLTGEEPHSALPMCHWLSTAAAFAGTGGLVRGDELADMIRLQCMRDAQPIVSQPVSLVARWIVAQRVLTINGPWGRMLPMFQFDLPRAAVHPGMRPLLGELKGALNEVELALWFVTPNEWLDGALPAVAMQTMLPAVRDAARADRYVALGG